MTKKALGNRLSNFNNMNCLSAADRRSENQKSYHYKNTNQNSNISKKVMVIDDSIVKYLRSDEFSLSDKSISIMKHLGFLDDMVDYVKPVVRKKPDTLTIHVGKNDLKNGVNMRKVRNCLAFILNLDKTENFQTGFSSIICRTDKDINNEIKETNIKMKNYCPDKKFTFVDNDNINESCLNNSKLQHQQ